MVGFLIFTYMVMFMRRDTFGSLWKLLTKK
jgi:hypothetical protein